VLLVHHQQPGHFDFWVPPGGALEGSESVLDCARREALEETGLHVPTERIVYIEEFVEHDYHFCKFWILCHDAVGGLTLARRPAGEQFLTEAKFFSREEMDGIVVYPEILRDLFWKDLEDNFPQTRYLGLKLISG